MRGKPRLEPVRPRWSRSLLALAIALALSLAGVPVAEPTAAIDGWDYTAERDAILPEIPADPGQAAVALVDLIYGDDFDVATFATMELLLRSGIPIVNLDGMVAALPDQLVLVDAAVAGEFVPNLTRSVRAGDFYTLAEAGDLLVDSGLFPEPLPVDALATALGQWGKPVDDPEAPVPPVESVVAGTAVRALGAKQGQVYAAALGTETATVDMLQLVLLFSHLAADAYDVHLPATGSGRGSGDPLAALLGIRVARAAESGDCISGLEAYDKTIGDTGGALLWETFKWALGNKELSEKFDKGKGKIDKVSAILTTLIWLTGIRMTMNVAPKGTHFRHEPGDSSRNVTVTATVRFDYPLSQNAAACWKLFANLDLFPQGPLPGFKVRWSMDQPLNKAANGKLLQPVKDPDNLAAFTPTGAGGATTNDQGQSKVVLEPAVERTPGSGKTNTGHATVIASVDKDDFPFALKDLIGLKDPLGWASDKTFDLVNSAIRRLGLPRQQVSIPVEHHGSDILVIEGTTTLFALWYFLPVYTRLWTCDGLNGRWQGVAGFKGDRTVIGDLVNKLWKIPEDAEMEKDADFLLDLTDGFDRAVILETMGLDVEVDSSQWNAGWKGRGLSNTPTGKVKLAGQVVGTASLTIGGHSAGPLAIFDGRSATFDVIRYSPDDFQGGGQQMCPGGTGTDAYFP